MPVIVDPNYGLSNKIIAPKNPILIKDIILELAKDESIDIYPLSVSNLDRVESLFAQGVLWGLFQLAIPDIFYTNILSFLNGKLVSNKFFVFQVKDLDSQFFCFSVTERMAIQIIPNESELKGFEDLTNLIQSLENQ